jgi:hypothetical protein
VQFIVAHHLPAEYFTPLLDYISQTKKVGYHLISSLSKCWVWGGSGHVFCLYRFVRNCWTL